MSRTINKRPARRGFLMADAMFGIFILGVTMVLLLVAVSRESTAETRLADARRATAIAEATLSGLQCGSPGPASSANTKITIEPCPGGRSIHGHHWARVTVRVNNQMQRLVGLVADTPSSGPSTNEVTR